MCSSIFQSKYIFQHVTIPLPATLFPPQYGHMRTITAVEAAVHVCVYLLCIQISSMLRFVVS